MGGKQERVTDSQVGEMDLCLCLINCLTSELLMHLLIFDSIVMDGGTLSKEQAVSFTGDGLQQRGTATIFRSEDSHAQLHAKKHLPGRPRTTIISPARTVDYAYPASMRVTLLNATYVFPCFQVLQCQRGAD